MISKEMMTKKPTSESGRNTRSDLYQEAARFFDAAPEDREERCAFQKAGHRYFKNAVEPERLSASAIQAFVNIARKWELTEEQERGLLGAVDVPTYFAWQADPHGTSLDQKVMTMTFSEFGRRVTQNASNGTDHGTAMPLFVVGSVGQTWRARGMTCVLK